jgi:hypothetical protein
MSNFLKRSMKKMFLIDSRWGMERDILTKAVPIPYFGNYKKAKICTIGINPSNKEFYSGHPCSGLTASDSKRIEKILFYYIHYFDDVTKGDEIGKQYQKYFGSSQKIQSNWFNKFGDLFDELHKNHAKPQYSYKALKTNRLVYESNCVHIDLAQWATNKKWRNLSALVQAEHLLDNASTFRKLLKCGTLLRVAPFEVIFLDGITAVLEFYRMSGVQLDTRHTTYTTTKGAAVGLDIYHGKYRNAKVVGWNRPLQWLDPKTISGTLAAEICQYC